MIWGRVTHDLIGLLAHVVAIVVISAAASSEYVNSATGKLVLAQEGVTAAAHIWYAILHYRHQSALFRRWPESYVAPVAFYPINRIKWFEYAVSATLGTVATLCTATVPGYIIAFVSIAAVAQQASGYQIDDPGAEAVHPDAWVAFGSAVMLQIGEFVVVGSVVDSPYVVATYATMWSLFGVHAGIRLCVRTYSGAKSEKESRWLSDEWSEAVYSCLSWTAKIAVAAITWAKTDAPDKQGTITAVTGTIVGVVLAATALQTTAPTPYNNLGNLYV